MGNSSGTAVRMAALLASLCARMLLKRRRENDAPTHSHRATSQQLGGEALSPAAQFVFKEG